MATSPTPATPAIQPHVSTLFTVLSYVLAFMPVVVQGLQAATIPGQSKKQIATDILGSAFQGLSTAHQLNPSNQTLTLVNQLTDVGIETAVSVLNNPPAAHAATAPTPAS